MTKRRVLITGGLGYLGGRITNHLAVSNQFSIQVSSRRKNHPSWIKEKAEVIALDFAAPPQLKQTLVGTDTVIHLASANEIECAADPEHAIHVNSVYTLRLLDACLASGVKRIIYLSTAHVYGSPFRGQISEPSTIPRPTHPYAISHKCAEDFLLGAHDRKNIEVVALRLSNSIGYPMDPQIDRWTLVGNDLCRQAATTPFLKINSSGMQWRDFIPMHEVCRAVAHFVDLPSASLGDGIFNLGGSFVCRIKDIANRIKIIAERDFDLKRELQFSKLATPEEQQDTGFELVVEKLSQTGFCFDGPISQSIDQEIFGTLKFCLENSKK